MKAVILAAGYGLRLRPLTEKTPKGLVLIADRPLLEHTFKALLGIAEEFLIVTGYLGEQIENHFGNAFVGIPIQYKRQDPINGTGTALHCFRDQLHERFLAVNGDDIYAKEDLENLAKYQQAILAVETHASNTFTIQEDRERYLAGFKSDQTDSLKLKNCGAYILNERFFQYSLSEIEVHGNVEYSLPHTLAAMGKGNITVVRASNWYPIGTRQEYDQAQKAMEKS